MILINSLKYIGYLIEWVMKYICFIFRYWFFKEEIKYFDLDIELGDPEVVDSDSLYRSIYENMDLGFTYKFAVFYTFEGSDTLEPLCIEGMHYYFEYPIPNHFTEYSFVLSEDKGWIKYYFTYRGEKMEMMIELLPDDKGTVNNILLHRSEGIDKSLAIMANNVWITYVFYCLEEVIEDIFKKSDLVEGIKIMYGDEDYEDVQTSIIGDYLTLTIGFIKSNSCLDYRPMIKRDSRDPNNGLTYKDLRYYGVIKSIIRVLLNVLLNIAGILFKD